MGASEPPQTRADVARQRLAQLAAAFDAELPPADAPPTATATPRVVPGHLRVVGAAAVAACLLLGWYLLAQRPSAGDPVEPVGFSSVAPTESGGQGGEIVVDVVGKVARPGIVTLPRGSRVHEAVEAAGGVKGEKVDTSGLNMARVLEDGEQIVVGAPSESSGAAAPGKLNLNQATAEQLDALPGVGPVTAQAILSWRDENGRFSSVDELLDVKGIGDTTLAELRDLVTV